MSDPLILIPARLAATRLPSKPLAEIAGDTVAQSVQLGLKYAPAPPFEAGRPETAPPEIRAICDRRFGAAMDQRRAEAKQAAAKLHA